MRRLADEIWWLHEGQLAGRGDPGEMLAAYRKHVTAQIRAWGETNPAALSPRMRRGDGRAEVVRVETIGENGCPTMVWRCGELAVVRVDRPLPRRGRRPGGRDHDPHAHRTERLRHEYGAGALKLGPLRGGRHDPGDLRLPLRAVPRGVHPDVASHDPDGVWHDWLEDAVAFAVADDRYTAGVANLRAQASFTLLPRMKVGTMPEAVEKPDFPVESQLEQPCTLPR